MVRLVVVWCPGALEGGPGGEEPRRFADVLDAAIELAPFARPVRLGVLAIPSKGPSRFFGGEAAFAEHLAAPLAPLVGEGASGRVGAAEGLFAAIARRARVGARPRRARRASSSRRGRSRRCATPTSPSPASGSGCTRSGGSRALEEARVLERFGLDAVRRHRVARGVDGELPGLRDAGALRRLDEVRHRDEPPRGPARVLRRARRRRDLRAAAAAQRLERQPRRRRGDVARLGGGRAPDDRAALVPWGTAEATRARRDHGARGRAGSPRRRPRRSPHARCRLVARRRRRARDRRCRRPAERGARAPRVRAGPSAARWSAHCGPWPMAERWWGVSAAARAPPGALRRRPRGPPARGAVEVVADGGLRLMARYAELHAHSGFSFLDGASDPEELVATAVALGLEALALTDHHGLYGAVRFAEAARALGIPSVFGAELTLTGGGARTGVPDPSGAHLLVLARDPAGLRRAVVAARRRAPAARREGVPDGRPRRARRAPRRPLARAHGVPQGHRARRPASPTARTAARRELDRLVAAVGRGQRRRRAVGPRRPARRRAQRRARGARASRRASTWCATNNVHYATPVVVPAREHPRGGARAPLRRRHGGVDVARAGRVPALARPSRRAASRGSPGSPSARPSSRSPARSTCGSSPRGSRTSRPPTGSTSRATSPGWSTAGATGGTGPATPSASPGAWAQLDHELVGHRPARVRGVLPHRLGPHPVLPPRGHLLPGPRLGRELGGLLRARGDQRRRGVARAALRAVPVAGARRPARHRRRHRVGASRGGDPVRLRPLRPPPRRPGRERDHLPAALRGARRRQALGDTAEGALGRGRARRAALGRGPRGARGRRGATRGSRRSSPRSRPRRSAARGTSGCTRRGW